MPAPMWGAILSSDRVEREMARHQPATAWPGRASSSRPAVREPDGRLEGEPDRGVLAAPLF